MGYLPVSGFEVALNNTSSDTGCNLPDKA